MWSVTPIRYHKRSALSNSAFYLVFKVRKTGLAPVLGGVTSEATLRKSPRGRGSEHFPGDLLMLVAAMPPNALPFPMIRQVILSVVYHAIVTKA